MKPKRRQETIRKILKNEKYIGDALLQKAYTVDFLSKEPVINNCIVPQYAVLCRKQPRANYSARAFYAGTGRAGKTGMPSD